MATSLPADAGRPPPDGNQAFSTSFATSYGGVVAFITVVAEGSFAKAGDRLGLGRSAVSRAVQKLEDQLGVRLISRTTRSLSLTAEGERFHAQCHPGVEHISRALDDMRELRDGPASGTLRVCSAVGFGRKVVAPLLWDFRAQYPGIDVELWLDDGPTDFAAQRVDVSFRNGRMEDSQIVAKQLVPMQMLVVASREYATRHGLPQSIDDVAQHRGIHFRFASGRVHEWEFKVRGELRKLLAPAAMSFNDADLVLNGVLAGHGIAQLAGYQIFDHLRAGRLVACLAQYAPDDRGHYLCYLNRQHLPTRIRVFIDFMTARIRALDIHDAGALPRGIGA